MFVIVIVYVPTAKSGLTILSSVVVLNTVSLSSFMIIISMVVGFSTLNSIETFPYSNSSLSPIVTVLSR